VLGDLGGARVFLPQSTPRAQRITENLCVLGDLGGGRFFLPHGRGSDDRRNHGLPLRFAPKLKCILPDRVG